MLDPLSINPITWMCCCHCTFVIYASNIHNLFVDFLKSQSFNRIPFCIFCMYQTQKLVKYRWLILEFIYGLVYATHNNDVIMRAVASQITSLMFTQSLFRRRSKKTSKLHITGLCAGNSLMTMTGEFHAQNASNVENISICWRHHIDKTCLMLCCNRPLPESTST